MCPIQGLVWLVSHVLDFVSFVFFLDVSCDVKVSLLDGILLLGPVTNIKRGKVR